MDASPFLTLNFRLVSRICRVVIITAAVATRVGTAASTAVVVGRTTVLSILFLLRHEVVDKDKLGLLEELAAGDVLLGGLLGQESGGRPPACPDIARGAHRAFP